MVRLNHSVKVDNKIVTPFLIEGDNVVCFNRRNETITLPIEKFKTKNKKKKVVVPVQITAPPIVPKAIIAPVKQKPEEPKEEIIVVKKEPIIEESEFSFGSFGSVHFLGSAMSSYSIVEEVIKVPPIVDNNRYVRPSLDDDYI